MEAQASKAAPPKRAAGNLWPLGGSAQKAADDQSKASASPPLMTSQLINLAASRFAFGASTHASDWRRSDRRRTRLEADLFPRSRRAKVRPRRAGETAETSGRHWQPSISRPALPAGQSKGQPLPAPIHLSRRRPKLPTLRYRPSVRPADRSAGHSAACRRPAAGENAATRRRHRGAEAP